MSAFIIREKKTYLLAPLTHQRLPSTGARALRLARDVVMILRGPRSKCRRPATFVSLLFLVATDRIMRALPGVATENAHGYIEEASTETSSRRSLMEIQKLRFLFPFFFSFLLFYQSIIRLMRQAIRVSRVKNRTTRPCNPHSGDANVIKTVAR